MLSADNWSCLQLIRDIGGITISEQKPPELLLHSCPHSNSSPGIFSFSKLGVELPFSLLSKGPEETENSS